MSRRDPQQGILNHGANGQYQFSTLFNLVATQAAGASVFSLRWGDATRLMVIDYLHVIAVNTAAFTATATMVFNMTVARGFTASDTAGTALSLAGNNNKLRTNMATSLVTDARVASGLAAGLTAGTRTLDGIPLFRVLGEGTITTPNNTPYENAFDARTGWTEPLILAQNEGICLINAVAFPAAGAASLVVDVKWSEVDAF
jgi:hypothetical protein